MSNESNLPETRRRWPWIFLAGCALLVMSSQAYRVINRSSVQRQLAELRQRGYPVNCNELQTWQPAVPDRENAAIQILEAADELAVDREVFGHFPARGEELGPEERDEFADAITNNVASLLAVHEAAQLKRSLFPIDYSRGPNTLLPHLAKVKSLSQLLRAEATLYSEEGKPDLAVRAVRDSIALAGSLNHEPTLISQLVRYACLSISCASLERVLSQHALAPEQIQSLQQALQEARDAAPKGFEAGYLGELCLASYSMNANPAELAQILNSEGGPTPWSSVMLAVYRWTGLWDKDNALYLSCMRPLIEGANGFPENFVQLKRTSQASVQRVQTHKLAVFSRMLLPSLEKSTDKAVEAESRLRCAQAALTVEKYRAEHNGALPQDLTPQSAPEFARLPKDPIDGAPLRYVRLEPGYTIYSVGADEADNGGWEKGGNQGEGVRKRPRGEGGKAPAPRRMNSTTAYDVGFTVER